MYIYYAAKLVEVGASKVGSTPATGTCPDGGSAANAGMQNICVCVCIYIYIYVYI